MTIEVENYIDISNNIKYKGYIWGSVDPRNGDLCLYSEMDCQLLEESYKDNKVSGRLSVYLESFNAIVQESSKGVYYQKTSNGLRSVFRGDVIDKDSIDSEDLEEINLEEEEKEDSSQEVNPNRVSKMVYYDETNRAWYLKVPKTSHIGFVVDTSGSMYTLYKNVVEQGIENFLEDQKALDNPTLLYGLTFSHEVNVLFNGVDLKKEDKIRDTFYSIIPGGSTAYRDAFKKVIRLIESRQSPGDEVVICCMTDGMDNASNTSVSELKQLISSKKEEGWIITLLGTEEANIDEMCDKIGIGYESGLQMGKTPETTINAYRSVSEGISRVRAGATPNLTFTSMERNISSGL
jgi:hypothetical protein